MRSTDKIIDYLEKTYQPESIIVYGSFAVSYTHLKPSVRTISRRKPSSTTVNCRNTTQRTPTKDVYKRQVQSSVDKVESTVGRFPKLLQTAIGKATGLITGQSGGYVVIHTSEENGPVSYTHLDVYKRQLQG